MYFLGHRVIIDSIACMEPLVFAMFAIGRGAMDGFPAYVALVRAVTRHIFSMRC